MLVDRDEFFSYALLHLMYDFSIRVCLDVVCRVAYKDFIVLSTQTVWSVPQYKCEQLHTRPHIS
jgi:hypothetical protein